jgi:hypothetical protein
MDSGNLEELRLKFSDNLDKRTPIWGRIALSSSKNGINLFVRSLPHHHDLLLLRILHTPDHYPPENIVVPRDTSRTNRSPYSLSLVFASDLPGEL